MIDIHTHPVHIAELHDDDPTLAGAVDSVFALHGSPQPLATYLGELDAAGIDRAVVLALDCTTARGCTVVSNDQVAGLVEAHDRLVGFASVDPNLPDAAKQLERAIVDLGLRGLALDPGLQGFALDDEPTARPVLEAASDLGVPVLVQCGLNWATPARSSAGHPLRLEWAVHELPALRVVITQCGFPWVTDALVLALKYPNVYLDTAIIYSGTPADSVRRVLGHEIGLDVVDRSLHHQIVFGSGSPRVAPKRMATAVRSLGLSPWLEHRLLHANAVELLGDEGSAS